MRTAGKYLGVLMVGVLGSGCLVGVSGLLEPVMAATESAAPVMPESSNGSEKAREIKGNHPMRKACAEDVKKFCSDVKSGEGRIVRCLKQHAQELTLGCSEMMQQHGKHRQ